MPEQNDLVTGLRDVTVTVLIGLRQDTVIGAHGYNETPVVLLVLRRELLASSLVVNDERVKFTILGVTLVTLIQLFNLPDLHVGGGDDNLPGLCRQLLYHEVNERGLLPYVSVVNFKVRVTGLVVP